MLLVVAWGWLVVVYPRSAAGAGTRAVELTLPADATATRVAALLAEAGLVRRADVWALYARVLGTGGGFVEGAVMVRADMTAGELLRRVSLRAGSVALRITFPEGFTQFDFARRLASWDVCEEGEFLEAANDSALLGELDITALNAEGHLFPDTYVLDDDTPPAALVRLFVDNAHRRLAALREADNEAFDILGREFGWELHEILTLASIVEKEAAVRAEQPIIAGVFLNRLRDPEFRPRRLQADPTVSYGCLLAPALASCRNFDGRRVTRRMTADTYNRYNTYRHEGLPPGPIANPGLDAVRGVLAPAEHRYLYFVARGDGRHVFSETLVDHRRAVDKMRRGRP